MRSYKRRAICSNSATRRRHPLERLENRMYLSGETGLRADYYNAAASVFSQNSLAVTTTPVLTRTDSTVNFNWDNAAADPSVSAQNFAVRWSGQVLTEQAGNYVFHVTTDAAVRLWVNGQLVIDDYAQHATADDASIALNLKANTLYNIQLDFAQTTAAGDSVSLQWVTPGGTEQVIPATQLYPFSQAITIDSGGIYVGSWENTAADSTTVTIATTQPVTIDDSIIRGAGLLIHNTIAGAQLTVEDSSGYGLNPNVAGVSKGDFLYALDAASVDVEHNLVDNVGGYGIDVRGFVGTGSQTIKILYNQIENADGRYSNGSGGYEDAGDPTPHAIILSNIQSVPGIEIGWNQIINQPGQSYVNDVINIYDTSGTAASPIQVHDNYIDGLYSPDPDTTYDSGSGIITDGETGSSETAYVDIHDNQVVATGNGGICIAAGHDVSIYDNRVISSGILPDGNSFYSSYVGMYIQDYMSGGSSANFHNDIAYNNVAAWMSPPHSIANTGSAAYENNYVFLNGSASGSYNNTSLGTATQAMESAEYTTWQAKLVSNNVTVGPVTLAPQTVTTTPTPPANPTPPPADPTPPPSVPTPTQSNPTPPTTGSSSGSGSSLSSGSGSSKTTQSNPPTTISSGSTHHRRRPHHWW
ncbi:MAG: PA14 domain-containing protein [Tepidisphaeraceae bacterium]